MNEGVITAIKNNEVTVEIVCRSACSECTQKGICQIRDDIKKKIVILTMEASTYRVGEKVILDLPQSNIYLSLFFAYILPLLLLLTGIVVGTEILKFSETLCAVVSLSIVIIYYGGIKFLNKWFAKHIKMTIRRKTVD